MTMLRIEAAWVLAQCGACMAVVMAAWVFGRALQYACFLPDGPNWVTRPASRLCFRMGDRLMVLHGRLEDINRRGRELQQ